MLDGAAGQLVVADVVPELAELVEDDRVGIPVKLGALVVDLLDVRLRAGRADDVSGEVTQPASQSKRSWLMPSGSTATPWACMMRLTATPPRQ